MCNSFPTALVSVGLTKYDNSGIMNLNAEFPPKEFFITGTRKHSTTLKEIPNLDQKNKYIPLPN
jgi:hypothetical protein